MEEYSHDLEKNLEALEMEVQALNEMRNDVLKRVSKEEGRDLQVLLEVREWVAMVEEIEAKAIPLLDKSISQLQKLSKYDDISASTHQYSEAVGMTLKEVETHKSKGVFKELVERAPLSHFKKMLPLQKIASREMLLEKTWKCLTKEGCRTLALYGMAGVGKTILLTQIKNKFVEVGYVPSPVIFVVVKSEKVKSIQDEIGERLGVNLGDEEKEKKAYNIFKFLYRKRFVLLLDGIQRKVDLEEIGIPQPSKENGCKIVFTSRSREACGSKWVDVVEEVECLSPKESWDLFRKTVGETSLKSHPDIPQLARIVARKCSGLPITLNLIGKIMSSKKTVREWRHAIHALVPPTAGYPDREVSILKFTYDYLPDEIIKSCFLYCALFPKNSDISKQDLVDCWISEGLLEEEDRETAENKGYEMIGDLVRVGLLMETESGYGVKMQGMVLEMALWVASHFGRGHENFVVQCGEKIHEMPMADDWNTVRRMSVTSSRIETISGSPHCSELTTLFLQENKNLERISSDFFQWMTSLVVLNLSCNKKLFELPEEVSSLVSLQFLNLSRTWINRLPLGLKELKKLIHLDLDYTSNLKEIEVIASLLNLQVLRLFCSVPMNLSLMESLQVVKGLKELTLTVVEDSVFARLLSSDRLTSCIRRICLRDLTITDGVIALLKAMFSLCELDIFGCNIPGTTIDWRSNIQMKSVHSGNVEMIPQFQNMRTVSLHECNGLRDLTWLIAAPSLDNLTLYKCPEIEKIISKEKYMAELGHTSEKPFQSLSRLSLNDLPKLESIYWTPLPFQVLQDIIISRCPKLRRLPFNSESAKGNQLRLDLNKEWIKGVQWEDEATEKRFSGFNNRDFPMMGEEQKIDGLENTESGDSAIASIISGKKVLQSETNITGVTMEHTHVYRISTPEVLKSHMIDDGGTSAVEEWTKGVEREDEATYPDKNWTKGVKWWEDEATEQHSSGFREFPKMAEEESVDGLGSELHPNQNKVLVGTTQSGEIATSSSISGNKVLQPETHATGLSWTSLSRDGSKGSSTTSFTYMPRTEGEIWQNANLKVFTLRELKSATRKFRPDNMVGEGGFGRVFKGWIDETTFAPSKPGTGIVIAVKRLKKEWLQGQREWLAEIKYLGQLDHPNLVKLIGYCLEEEDRLLVYEFMPRGSLENHLFRRGLLSQPLSWNSRIRMVLDAARGLAFLHNAQPQVIYRGFKPSNILLDSNYNAKLSDFTLARDGPTGDQSHVTTRIMGTYGYAAPEYMATGHLTSKSDVYSFGVVLLELLSGRRAFDRNQPVGEQSLVEWAKPYLKNKRRLLRVMDPCLKGQYSLTRALKVAILALECINIDYKIRPTMNDIFKTLEELSVHKEAPEEQQNLQPDNSENNTEITNIVETKVCCEGCFGR